MKAGYKQTEIGLIPEDWEFTNIGREFDIQLGAMLDANKNSGIPVPYIGNANVQWGKITLENLPLIKLPSNRLNRYRLQHNDLMVCEGGEVGRAAIFQHTINACYYQKALHRLRSRGKYDNNYMYYILYLYSLNGKLDEYTTKTSIAHIPKEKLSIVIIPLPPLPEQQAIAAALSDVDQLIASLDQLIEKRRALKTATMQQLLTGKTRLKGFSGEWEMKRLGDIAHLYQPQTIGQSVFTSEGYPVYGANGIIGRYSRYNHTTRQITISCRGNCGTVNMTEPLSWITGNAMVVNLDHTKSIDWDFAYHLLMFQDFSILVTGSGQPQIVRGPLKEFAIIVPKDVDEQVAISAVLSDMDTEIMELEKQRDKTQAIKQGMMQELLTGRTRLI